MVKVYSPVNFQHIITYISSKHQCFDSYWLVDVKEGENLFDILLEIHDKKHEIDWIEVIPIYVINNTIIQKKPLSILKMPHYLKILKNDILATY
jgi:hypothetical protein